MLMVKGGWSKETSHPGGVFYLLCSLIKSRVYEISRRDATVASGREISYTRLLIREPLYKKTPPGGGFPAIKVVGYDWEIVQLAVRCGDDDNGIRLWWWNVTGRIVIILALVCGNGRLRIMIIMVPVSGNRRQVGMIVELTVPGDDDNNGNSLWQ